MTRNTRQATYTGEEISATFQQTFVRDDYGVHGSQHWAPQNDVEIVLFSIGDVNIDPGKLPADAADAIVAFAGDLDDWR